VSVSLRRRSAAAFAATVSVVAAGLALAPRAAAAQLREDAFSDPAARRLFVAAQANWATLDESILRYTATIQQRIAALLRTPLKDRVLYRNETAVRAFWDHEYDAVVQVMGTHSQYPGRTIAMREGDLDWLEDLPFDEPFDPGADRLFFGMPGSGRDEDQPERRTRRRGAEIRDESRDEDVDAEFWVAHPLAHGADSLYRYESGDTLAISLPDGRRLLTVQLDVVPTIADVHRISGTLWIEPESGALVRAVYRLSRQFDAIRDIAELQEEEEAGSFRYVPGLFKPWTFDLNMIAVDYALWDFEVWLPRSMRMEGEVGAGILKMPVQMDVAYQIESVHTRLDEERAPERLGSEALIERHFETRAEAMAFLAGVLSEEDDIEYEPAETEPFARDRRSYMIVPEDRASVASSPRLPAPIWEEAEGFPSDEEIEEYVTTLADLPTPAVEGLPWRAHMGWARPDLFRYNRVEGPALGGGVEAEIGGPHSLSASGFFGFADREPKARVELRRSTVRRRLTLGGYRELAATDPRGRYLGFGNSVNAFLFGRDDGEYYMRTGADLTWRRPEDARDSRELRLYVERQDSTPRSINYALLHAFDPGWDFRPNIFADEVEEVGAELRLSPWRGGDPFGTQIGLELYGHGARWRPVGGSAATDYARARAVVRLAAPLGSPRWRLGMEAGGGHTWGDAPLQRSWFLGGATTLRGYPASSASGPTFGRARIEVARNWDVGGASLFWDAGWAGVHTDFDWNGVLHGVGVGGSVLDGLLRMDFSHGLTGPLKQFRVDLYLDALL